MAISGVAEGRLAWVRFHLKPVEEISGAVNSFSGRVVGTTTAAGADTTGVPS